MGKVLEKQEEKRNSEKTDRTLRDAKQMRKQQVKRRKEEISGQGAHRGLRLREETRRDNRDGSEERK
ncbi:hypothetical protein K0M31_018447 [Melipona bicolor]|uniref:Uncharacterized protein n=1 Tax=Melipona bicolor TaxID=60889 RepID=A0AA40G3F3_9HYME|nr:hypothetical protein K0M31_018447 [Melipona bicolor]